MNNKNFRYSIAILVLVVFSVGSFAFGAYASQKQIIKFKFTAVSSAQAASKTNTNTDLFFTVWNTLKEKSIHYNDVTDEDRMYGAIKGLTASLGDPYTEFMPPSESKKFNESIAGSFDGIGAEIGKSQDDILTVIAPLKGSPAEIAGLKSGDKILKIDGVVTNDMSIDESILKIRGKKGTVVKLEIYRTGALETQVISVTRDTIVIPTVESEIIDGVYVIHISSFGEKATKDFEKAINSYKTSGLNHMVIDLRGNPGGYLEAAVDIGSYFIPKGKTIVVEDFVKNNQKEIHTSYGYSKINKPKLVVLIDGGSASASEILAGSLSDYKIATLVGVKTFGKGSVQELIPMKGGTNLKVTIARWLTPNGIAIDKEGIKPDIEVKRIYDEKNPKVDNQLNKAIQVVKSI